MGMGMGMDLNVCWALAELHVDPQSMTRKISHTATEGGPVMTGFMLLRHPRREPTLTLGRQMIYPPARIQRGLRIRGRGEPG